MKPTGNLKQLPDGRYVVDIRTRVDLGVVTEERARKVRAQMEPPPGIDNDGAVSWHESAIARLRAQRGEAVPLDDVWGNYSERVSDGRSSTTGAYYRRWQAVKQWADDRGIVTLGQLDEKRVTQMAADLGKRYSGNTLNATMAAARVITGATVGRQGRNPFAFNVPVKAHGRDHRPFTSGELRIIFERATGEVLTACYILAYSGQRASDVGSWTWDRVDFGRGIMSCRQRKTGTRIELPMHPALATYLWNLKASQPEPRAHIMPGLAARQEKEVNSTASEINRFLKRIGFRSSQDGIVGSHSFRYTYVSTMRELGVPDGVIQAIVGHSNKAMTDHYSRVGLEAMTKAVAQLPAFTVCEQETQESK